MSIFPAIKEAQIGGLLESTKIQDHPNRDSISKQQQKDSIYSLHIY